MARPAPPTATILLRIQPRAARTEVVGRHGDAIKIRIKAPPVDGAANEELIRFLARRFDVPRRRISIVNGAGSRQKRVSIHGVTEIAARRVLLGVSPSPREP